MASTRALRQRIRSVRTTRQITRAQELVATAKLRAATQAAQDSRHYPDELQAMLDRLLCQREYRLDHSWLRGDSAKPVLAVILASDQGLAGSFQSNLLRQAVQLHSEGRTLFLPVGRRLYGSLRQMRYSLEDRQLLMPRQLQPSDIDELASIVTGLFDGGAVGEVRLVSTVAKTALLQEVRSERLLPYVAPDRPFQPAPLYEPSADETLDALLRQYLRGRLYSAYLQSKAAEYAARRTAMHAATDNASKLIGDLQLAYNRLRQANITTEIAEIVGGAAALSS